LTIASLFNFTASTAWPSVGAIPFEGASFVLILPAFLLDLLFATQ
jgi:hypothetical protein